jgi:predicted Fe-S protein YdhL (DUF1289 family)
MNCCLDCQKRYLGCHSECQEYLDWVKENEERKKQIFDQKRKESTHKKAYKRYMYGVVQSKRRK